MYQAKGSVSTETRLYGPAVHIRAYGQAEPFTTADGSTIRELLGLPTRTGAEPEPRRGDAPPGQATERHYHRESEEFYYLLEGSGEMEIDGERARVGSGDAILIAAGRVAPDHRRAGALRFLCCCAPPYRHEDTYFT